MYVSEITRYDSSYTYSRYRSLKRQFGLTPKKFQLAITKSTLERHRRMKSSEKRIFVLERGIYSSMVLA